ncbi:MAG: hypothetical protein ACYC6A_22415 [Armatimonadota bacterium]
MFLTPQIHRDRRRTYRYDALGNVAGAMLSAMLNAFGLFLAKQGNAPDWIIFVGVAGLFTPSLLAWMMPLLLRRFPLGGTLVALRLLAGFFLLPCIIHPSRGWFLFGYTGALILIVLADYVYPSLLRILYRAEEQRSVLSTIFAVRAVAMFIMFLALGAILDRLTPSNGFRVLGVLAISFSVISACATWRFRRIHDEPAKAEHEPRDASPWTNRLFLRYLVILTVFGIGNVGILVLWPILAAVDFQFTNTEMGWFTALGMLMQLVAYSWFSRHGTVPLTMRITAGPFITYALPCLVAAALLVWGAHWSHVAYFWVLLPSMLLFNLGAGVWSMYFYLLVNKMAEPSSPMPYHAIQGTVIGVRGIAFSFLIGLFYQHFHMLASLLLTAGFLLAATVMALLSPGSIAKTVREQPVLALEKSAK